MYRTAIIIGKKIPDWRGLFLIFEWPAMFYTLFRLLHGYLAKWKMYLLPAFVVSAEKLSAKEVDVA